MLMQTYVGMTTVIFGFLFVIWSRSSWLNACLKFVFLSCMVMGLVLIGQLTGYIVTV